MAEANRRDDKKTVQYELAGAEEHWSTRIKPVEARKTILKVGMNIARELEQQRDAYGKLININSGDLYIYPAFTDHRLSIPIKKEEMKLIRDYALTEYMDNHVQQVPFLIPERVRKTDSLNDFANEGAVIYNWDTNLNAVRLSLAASSVKPSETHMVRRGRMKYLEFSLFMRGTFEGVIHELQQYEVDIPDIQIALLLDKWNKYPQYRFALTKQMITWLSLFQILEGKETQKAIDTVSHYIEETYIRSFLATETKITQEQTFGSRGEVRNKLKRNHDDYQFMCTLSIVGMKSNGFSALIPDEVVYNSMMQLYMIGATDNAMNPEQQSMHYNNYRNIQDSVEKFLTRRNWENILIQYGSGLSNALVYYPHIVERMAYIDKMHKFSIMDTLDETKNFVCDQIFLFIFGCLPNSALAKMIYSLPSAQKKSIIRKLIRNNLR